MNERFRASKEDRQQAVSAAENILSSSRQHTMVLPREAVSKFDEAVSDYMRSQNNSTVRSGGTIEKDYDLLSQKLKDISSPKQSVVLFSSSDREVDLISRAVYFSLEESGKLNTTEKQRGEFANMAYGFVDFLFAHEEHGGGKKDTYIAVFEDIIDRKPWVNQQGSDA